MFSAPIPRQLLDAAYKRLMDSPAFKGAVKGAEGGADAAARMPFNMIENEAKNASAAGYDFVNTTDKNGNTVQVTKAQASQLANAPAQPNNPSNSISFGQTPDVSSDPDQIPIPKLIEPPSIGIAANNPNMGEAVKANIEARTAAMKTGTGALKLRQNATEMLQSLRGPDGKLLVNTGIFGAHIQDWAEALTQMGVPISVVQAWSGTDPNNGKQMEKNNAEMVNELTHAALEKGDKFLATDINMFKNSTPGIDVLPLALEAIMHRHILPQAANDIAMGDAAAKTDILKDNVPAYLFNVQKSLADARQAADTNSFNKGEFTTKGYQANADAKQRQGQGTTTPAPNATANGAPKYQEGQTATGPNGTKMKFTSGKWVPNQ